MVYGHNSGGPLFCNLPTKIDDVIRWDLLVFYSFLNFSSHISIYSDTSTRFYDLKSTNKGLCETSDLDSNFDKITMKLGIISICPVAWSCYTSPTSSLVPWEDDWKHWPPASVECQKICPTGRLLVTIKATGQIYIIIIVIILVSWSFVKFLKATLISALFTKKNTIENLIKGNFNLFSYQSKNLEGGNEEK